MRSHHVQVCSTILGVAVGALIFPNGKLEAGAPKSPIVYLNQGWSYEDRQAYYWTSQGSALLSYDIFLNLEQAKGQHFFRSDENVARLGLIPQDPEPRWNPDGLPLGWTRTSIRAGRWEGDWLGISCAGCHNSQLEYKGTKIRIDGGNNSTFDLHAFLEDLDQALHTTVHDEAKFARLTARLVARDRREQDALRARLEADAAYVHQVRRFFQPSFPVGPGRMDALDLVHNQILGIGLGYPENWLALNAPVKWPFLWNAPQSAWVGWRGTQQFPLLRNSGESLGLWSKVDLRSRTPEEGLFESSVDLRGQIEIEKLLRRLAPPRWPEDVLGTIDREKAARGAQVFAENCAECHSTWPQRWTQPKRQGKRFIENALVPISVVGTDATQGQNLTYGLNPTVFTGALAPYLPDPWRYAVIAPDLMTLVTGVQLVTDKALQELQLSEAERDDATGYRNESEPLPPNGLYKAAPREGTWAIAPYLHNGSVPNLYELLLPARERSRTFFIGREFDPIKVGVDTSGQSGTFLFDTALTGNSNSGHSFEDGPRGNGVIGRLLSEAERWDLIEYLKSIPSEDAQITPFGGPKQPIEAWKDPTFYHVKTSGGYQAR